MNTNPKILIIGATGFVGRNLLQAFEAQGETVRVMVRSPQKLTKKTSQTEVFKGDLLERQTLLEAFEGIETVYFLAHALDKSHDFEDIENFQAKNCQEMADAAGVGKIIYLGGLVPEGNYSKHLRSRVEVGNLLSCGKTPVIELRASIVFGEGSFPFEMIKSLVERLPFIVSPSWANQQSQPLSLPSLMNALYRAEKLSPPEHHTIIEIGDDMLASYADLLNLYAEARGLVRPILKSKLISPELASKVLDWVIPEYSVIGKKLLESMNVPTIVQSKKYWDELGFTPNHFSDYVKKLIVKERDEDWSHKWEALLDNPELQQIIKFSQIYYHFEFPIQEKAFAGNIYHQLKRFQKISELLSSKKRRTFSIPTLTGGDINVDLVYQDGTVKGAVLLSPGKFLDNISIVLFKQVIQRIHEMKEKN